MYELKSLKDAYLLSIKVASIRDPESIIAAFCSWFLIPLWWILGEGNTENSSLKHPGEMMELSIIVVVSTIAMLFTMYITVQYHPPPDMGEVRWLAPSGLLLAIPLHVRYSGRWGRFSNSYTESHINE